MSELQDVHGELRYEWRRFLDEWEKVRLVWRDAQAAQFAKRFIDPWETNLPTFLSKLELLEKELQLARREL